MAIAPHSHKHVYTWGDKKADGDGSMKALLGSKGANLAEMTRIGLPVPPGFTITTEVCTYYYGHEKTHPSELQAQMVAGIANMENIVGTKFGATDGMPLLVSVRSGARDSMPGLMDTILNLGLNDQSVLALEKATGNPRFAWDCYRRLIRQYAVGVLGVQSRFGEDHGPFEIVSHEFKQEKYHAEIEDAALTAEDQTELVKRFKALVVEHTGEAFPSDPWAQLRGAVGAVFSSWMSDRAIVYRHKYSIPSEYGTAANVQAMVFPNIGDSSGSGVAFTRNPANGFNEFYGEFARNALGEEIVAGVRAPEPLSYLEAQMPKIFAELKEVRSILEHHFKDMQDFEFVVQEGRLFLLQTRNGKRTFSAALKIAVNMVREKIIDAETAVLRIPPEQLEQLFAPIFDPAEFANTRAVTTGLPGSPGVASGKIYLNADRAAEAGRRGEKILLVRNYFCPEDLQGMLAAEGMLSAQGGLSSSGALVSRQMGKACICGMNQMRVDYTQRTVTIRSQTFQEGDLLSIDGTAGTVYAGQIKIAPSEIIAGLQGDKAVQATEKFVAYSQLMQWCSQFTRLQVRGFADTPEQIEQAIAFGATGIGLIRTDHMFYDSDRIDSMREMILAETHADREAALAELLPQHRDDFREIFRALKGLPATIRLLDPPLHKFLPHDIDVQTLVAHKLNLPVDRIMKRVQDLDEFNPMLGFRGCRLGIRYPEITRMQARAMFEAAALCLWEQIPCNPEILIPMVGFKKELDCQAAIVHAVAKEVEAEHNVKLTYRVGAMIEVPRAALTADEFAQSAEFLSFGTNDLTQTCLGMSRDDSGSFLDVYKEMEIIKKDPFASLDHTGVGQLMEIAIAKGKKTQPDLQFGICGEHGGDPASIKFCHRAGLSHVSCSPNRVPIARLAAAQAAIEERRDSIRRSCSSRSGIDASTANALNPR